MKLIDKDAFVAEIKNLENAYKKIPTSYNSYEEGLKEGRLIGYKDALHKINTLEVKEVDLEKHLKEDIEDVFFDLDGVAVKGATHYLTVEDVKDIAKHFFELGLKTQKGEQVDYGKLKTSLDNALSKETKESWEKFLQEEQKTSVWHDANDEPDENVEIVFQWHLIDSEDKWLDTGFYDKELGCFKTVGVLGGCDRVQMKYIIKWAKASDLLKL